MAEDLVRERIEGGVAVLTMNRPQRRNAFNDAMWTQMRDAMEGVLANPAVRVAVLTGAGGAFTAGVDLESMRGLAASEPQEGEHPFESVMRTLCEFDKPLIAAVDGVGVGFGLTVLLHCDFVFVTPNARLRAPFVRLGVVPEAGSSYLLPLLLGHRKAAEVLYAADWIDAERAVELGIANRCVPVAELMPTALELAKSDRRQPACGPPPHQAARSRHPPRPGARRPRARARGVRRESWHPREHGGDHRVLREAEAGFLGDVRGSADVLTC